MINSAEIQKLAQLSRIKLSSEEAELLVKEFDSILAYVDQLKKVDVSVAPQGRIGAIKNITRPDKSKDVSLEDQKSLLKEAPKLEGDFIAVKKIIAQD